MQDSREVSMRRQLSNSRTPSQLTSRKGVTQLKEKFIRWGIESLADHEVIELLFSITSSFDKYKKYTIECTKQFGSLRQLMEASPEELRESGIARDAMLLIRLMSEIPARILKQKAVDKPVYRSSRAVFDYLYYSMRRLKNEVFKVIHLNRRNQILEAIDLFEGTVDNIPIIPRQIVENAIRCRAVSVIYAHNHPSGDPTPSKSDKQLTRDLVFIGNIVQIRVLDHIIIGDDSHFSFADEGLIEKYEDSFLTLRMKAGV